MSCAVVGGNTGVEIGVGIGVGGLGVGGFGVGGLGVGGFGVGGFGVGPIVRGIGVGWHVRGAQSRVQLAGAVEQSWPRCQFLIASEKTGNVRDNLHHPAIARS